MLEVRGHNGCQRAKCMKDAVTVREQIMLSGVRFVWEYKCTKGVTVAEGKKESSEGVAVVIEQKCLWDIVIMESKNSNEKQKCYWVIFAHDMKLEWQLGPMHLGEKSYTNSGIVTKQVRDDGAQISYVHMTILIYK